MKKIGAGLVGLNFGKFILDKAIVKGDGSPYFDLVAVCDLNRERVDAISREFHCAGHYSLNDLLEDPAVEVVILMTAPLGRAELISQIIHSGRDVITTKPFETDPEAAKEVLEEARRLGRFVYLNSPCATRSSDWELIDRWRRQYKLGRPVAGHFEAWHKSVEASDGTWYDDPDSCFVAPLLRLGIYGINDLVPLFGQPEQIQILESRIFTARPTADLARVQMKFPDGCLVELLNGFTMQPGRSEDSMILYFENGTIYRNPPLWVSNYPSGMTYLCLVTPECRDGMPVETVRLPNYQCSRAYQWKTFHEAIRTRKRPASETPDQVIIDGVRLLNSIKEAAISGGVSFPSSSLASTIQ
jgi:predicted dehydrogenase